MLIRLGVVLNRVVSVPGLPEEFLLFVNLDCLFEPFVNQGENIIINVVIIQLVSFEVLFFPLLQDVLVVQLVFWLAWDFVLNFVHSKILKFKLIIMNSHIDNSRLQSAHTSFQNSKNKGS